jgi:hypothetical protein
LRDLKLQDEIRRDVELLRDHPSTRDGDQFVEAALVDLAEELDALESERRK